MNDVTNVQVGAIVLLIKEIMDQIDEVATIKKYGGKANISLEVLREICGVLHTLPQNLEQTYFDLVLKLADKQRPPRALAFDEEYAHLSVNAKKRFVNRIKQDLTLLKTAN